MPAIYTVDPRSGVPIYLQLIDLVKRSVALGALAGGEQLPTVKALALELTVNPNTVARAYRELERDGIIETSPGRGSFVKSSTALAAAQESQSDVTLAALTDAVRGARAIGMEVAELRSLFDRAVARWYASKENA